MSKHSRLAELHKLGRPIVLSPPEIRLDAKDASVLSDSAREWFVDSSSKAGICIHDSASWNITVSLDNVAFFQEPNILNLYSQLILRNGHPVKWKPFRGDRRELIGLKRQWNEELEKMRREWSEFKKTWRK